MYAAAQGHVAAVTVSPKRLLDASPWLQFIPANASGSGPHRASISSRFGQVLINKGAKLNLRSKDGRTAVRYY
jgi:hypothetical protein